MVESTRVRSKRLSFSGKKTLSSFMQVNIASLRQSGKLRTSETYRATLNSFMKFMDGKDVLLSNMDAELMMGYETYLKAQGASMNTVSFYMRILRATYNRAVDKGVIRQRFPFKHVYTGVEKTVKRAISFKVIRQLKEMDLSHSQSMEFARDMFMFSFYTRGMSFVDMAFLKKTDLNNGMLTYRRKKTGQLLSIRWEKCMQDIVDKYPVCLVNRRLKEIGKKLGLVHPLTMYVARHSWASVARGKHIPLSVISEGMGHDSEKTTLIYLAALDTTVIDKANMVVLREFL